MKEKAGIIEAPAGEEIRVFCKYEKEWYATWTTVIFPNTPSERILSSLKQHPEIIRVDRSPSSWHVRVDVEMDKSISFEAAFRKSLDVIAGALYARI